MKKINYLALIAFAATALSTVSCVESSSKYKALVSQRDSIQVVASEIESEYNETLAILGDIQDVFRAIRESEGNLVLDVQNIEGQTKSDRAKISAEVNMIKDLIDQNRAKIKSLNNSLRRSNNKSSALAKTIAKMEAELVARDAAITALQEEIAKYKIAIEGLNTAVATLTTNVADLSTLSDKQKAELAAQTEAINTVWYCFAKSSDLKAGMMRSTKAIAKGEFDNSQFTKGDKTQISSFPLNSKKGKILSSHPINSYELVKGEDKMVTLNILDADKFWSITKYLVVKIK